MSIPVQCPNGHKHKVKDSFAGKVGLCPICNAPIHVPDKATEDAIMDILQPETTGLSGIGLVPADVSRALKEAAAGAEAGTKAGAGVEAKAAGGAKAAGEVEAKTSAERPIPSKVCKKCHNQIPDDAEECLYCKVFRDQVAAVIREKRFEKDMSLEAAAKQAGVPMQVWKFWEAGRHITLEALPTIAKALGCTARALLPLE